MPTPAELLAVAAGPDVRLMLLVTQDGRKLNLCSAVEAPAMTAAELGAVFGRASICLSHMIAQARGAQDDAKDRREFDHGLAFAVRCPLEGDTFVSNKPVRSEAGAGAQTAYFCETCDASHPVGTGCPQLVGAQRCDYCGCTDGRACPDDGTGRPCHWVGRDLCSNPACIAAAKLEGIL